MRRYTRFRRISSRRSRRLIPPSIRIIRYRLAVAVITLFAAVCLTSLLVPETSLISQLLPLVASLITLVLRYYFGRQEDE